MKTSTYTMHELNTHVYGLNTAYDVPMGFENGYRLGFALASMRAGETATIEGGDFGVDILRGINDTESIFPWVRWALSVVRTRDGEFAVTRMR